MPVDNTGTKILPTEQELIQQGSRAEDIKSIDNQFFYDRSGVDPGYVRNIYDYYMGGYEMPGSAGDIAAETAAPVVTAPVTSGQGQGGGGAPVVTGAAQPATTDYLGGATEGTSTIGNLADLTTPTTVGPFDYTDAPVTTPALDLSGTSEELIDRGVIETPQEWYARTYDSDPTMIGQGPLHQIGSDFPADYESLDNEERAIIDQEYANAYGINTTPEGSLIDKIKTGAGTVKDAGLAALGAAVDLPLGLAKKAMDAIPESQSQIEYEGYSPTQRQAIDAAYGTGGVMEGYNKTSIAGEGALATVNERIANREANVSDPANDKTLQELKALRDTLDPQPVTYVDDWGITRGDAITAEEIAAADRAALETALGMKPSIADVTGDTPISGPPGKGDPEMTYTAPREYTMADVAGPVQQEPDPAIADAALSGSFYVPSDSGSDRGSEPAPSPSPSRTQTMKEEEWATGSYTGGDSGGGGGCFLKGTQVTMADGSTKAIEQVDLGDNVAKGGKVFATGKFLVDNLHDYKGIKVSGSHMVNEDGNWTRVEDSKHGKALGDDEHTVYVFGAENRRILINNILFTDYFEVKEQEKLSEGDKFFDNWKIHAKVDSNNNVNILNGV